MPLPLYPVWPRRLDCTPSGLQVLACLSSRRCRAKGEAGMYWSERSNHLLAHAVVLSSEPFPVLVGCVDGGRFGSSLCWLFCVVPVCVCRSRSPWSAVADWLGRRLTSIMRIFDRNAHAFPAFVRDVFVCRISSVLALCLDSLCSSSCFLLLFSEGPAWPARDRSASAQPRDARAGGAAQPPAAPALAASASAARFRRARSRRH